MSEFLTVPPARAAAEPPQGRALETLATLLIFVVTVGILFVGREIFVPISIAVLMSFVLSPLCRILRHSGFNRVLSVWTVVLATLLVAAGLSAILTRQVTDLAAEAPKYQAVVMDKITNVRQMMSNNPTLDKIFATVDSIGSILPRNQPAAAPSNAPAKPAADGTPRQRLQTGQPRPENRPVPVEIREPTPGLFSIIQTVAGTALSPLATTAIVAIFTIFILLQREDLRDRFIRLVGSHDLQRTTVAMNDAAKRLSRYFLIQMLINTGFGILVAVGLTIIGVPSPVLWGIVSLLLRFVPYIGSVISAVLPIALAAAVDPGWTMVFETMALFGIAEPLVGQVVEPMLYGHNTGLSPIAVIVSATFWTWLWGPIGLVLSTPLTVCLVVLGRHADRLEFLDIVFGDAPALTPIESFYQRLLAADSSEISDQAEQYLRDHSLLDYYDEVAMQALLLAQLDVRRGVLDAARQIRIRDTIAELIEDLADHVDAPAEPAATPGEEPYASLGSLRRPAGPDTPRRLDQKLAILTPDELPPGWDQGRPLICLAGRGPLDEAAAALLTQLLQKHGLPATVQSNQALAAAGDLKIEGVQLACLSFLDAEVNLAHARYVVRRLRRRLPGVAIHGGYWTAQGDTQAMQALCGDTRTDGCSSNLADAVAHCLAFARSAGEVTAPATAHVA